MYFGGNMRHFWLEILVCTMMLAACGDDDSGFATQPDVEGSSSSVAPMSSDSVEKNDGSVYNVDKNTLTDLRDGQIYKTVKIGTQTWMAQNLNYAYTGVPYNYFGFTSDSTSWCYNNDVANCIKYGRLYTWAAAMDSVGSWSTNGRGCGYKKKCWPIYPVRGICPEGWHLPDTTEWRTLFTAVGDSSTAGKILKSSSGWNDSGNGTDAYSFSALPAGINCAGGSCFSDEGNVALFWSSAEFNRDNAYCIALSYNYDFAGLINHNRFLGFSVRCVKD